MTQLLCGKNNMRLQSICIFRTGKPLLFGAFQFFVSCAWEYLQMRLCAEQKTEHYNTHDSFDWCDFSFRHHVARMHTATHTHTHIALCTLHNIDNANVLLSHTHCGDRYIDRAYLMVVFGSLLRLQSNCRTENSQALKRHAAHCANRVS